MSVIADPPDGDSGAPEKYFLLKSLQKSNVGSRDSDGSVKEFFDAADIGVVQSSALLQGLNEDEFKKGSVEPNQPYIAFINTGRFETTGRGADSVQWNAGSSNRETEENFANAVIAKVSTKIAFWRGLGNQLGSVSNFVGSFATSAQAQPYFQAIIDGKTYTESSTGADTNLIYPYGLNVIDAINKIYGPTKNSQEEVLSKQLGSLSSVVLKAESLEDKIVRTIGPIFSTTIVNDFKDLVGQEHILSGIMQNFMLIKQVTGELSVISFSGMPDTPTGYDEGKFLRSTATGIEYVDISGQVPVSFLDDIIDKPTTEVVGGYLKLDTDGKLVWSPATTNGDIAYTITGATHISGLLDTPDGYDEGKFLRSTSNGVEYVDISGQVPVSFLDDIIDKPTTEVVGGYLKLDTDGKLVWSPATTNGDIAYTITGATHISGLLDTPDGYDEGKFLRSTSNGVEYVDISGQISSQQINWIAYPLVSDLPSASEHHGMFAHVHGEGSAYMAHAGSWNKIYPASESENINSLTGLSDTPAVYESGKYLVSTETGIEYRDIDLGTTSLTGLSFTGFSDTPAVYESGKYLVSTETGVEYRDREYLGKDIPVYPNSYNDTDSLPPDPQNRDGELVKVGCELYLSCNGKWINTTSENLSVTSQLPGCINNLEEAVQYSEYKDKFLAENSSDSFAAGFDGGIEPLVIDVCMHIDSNNSIYDSDHSLKIVETSYKWGIFKNPQAINIEALTSNQNCTFSQWTSSSAAFEDQNNSHTSLLIDTDTSITGSFFCFGSIDEPVCEDIALHLQPAVGETIADESSNNHQITIQGNATVDNTATLFGGGTMNFDGAGDYLSVAHSDLFNFGSDDFTIEMWINFNSQPAFDSVVMSHGDSGTNSNDWGWMFWSTGPNNLSFFSSLVGEGSNWSGSVPMMDSINLHQWYHIAIVKKSGTVYTYVDGVLQNQRSHSASIKNVTQNLIIGRSHWSNRSAEFDGYFQDIRISKKALYTEDFAPPSNLFTKPCPK